MPYVVSVPHVSVPPPSAAQLSTAWNGAARVTLTRDLNSRQGDRGETTTVYIEVDDKAIYVLFVCDQNAPIIAEQQTNNSGVESDDYVSVDLWPGGVNGITYAFSSTPNGTHNQSSSENTAFAPQWLSLGKIEKHSFTIFMRIPRDALHGNGRSDWRIQFERVVNKELLDLVWAWNPAMSVANDPLYAGVAQNMTTQTSGAPKPRARFQPYVLFQSNAGAAGASASRCGLDFSIPLASGTSFYGTVHPDYSDVERDQQTIAPSQFAYHYTEVRPFFTQGSNYFDQTTLYTPVIPTPRYGYAIEGSQDNLTYAGFNALGANGRDDNAETFSWTSADRHYAAGAQRVGVTYPGGTDTASSLLYSLGNGAHLTVFGTFAWDTGSHVSDSTQAKYNNLSVDWYGPNKNLLIQRNDYGAQFAPADSYVTLLDAHGYSVSAYEQFPLTATRSALNNVTFNYYTDRYRNSAGQVNQVDTISSLALTSKKNLRLNLTFDTTRGLDPLHGMVPYDQSGVLFFDGANSARNFAVGYYAGHFYNGFLHNLSTFASYKIAAKQSINLSDVRYTFTSAFGREVQRLDEFSYVYQYGRNGSFAAGIRWIVGSPAYFIPIPRFDQENITASINQRFGDWHMYLVYGDPNSRTTVPSIIFKLVRSIGAPEGT